MHYTKDERKRMEKLTPSQRLLVIKEIELKRRQMEQTVIPGVEPVVEQVVTNTKVKRKRRKAK